MWGCTSYFANHKVKQPKNTSYAGYLRVPAAASSRQGSQGPGCNFISWVGQCPKRGGGVLQRIVGWGVPPGPPNPDPILDQKNNAIFLSFTFGIETTNVFIHSRSSLHTRFQTKMGKVYTRFETQTAQNYTLLGGTYL